MEMLQGGDAADGDALAGKHHPHGHDGTIGTVAASATRWHCMARHRVPLSPELGQVMGHSSPMAVPDCEPGQAMGRAKP